MFRRLRSPTPAATRPGGDTGAAAASRRARRLTMLPATLLAACALGGVADQDGLQTVLDLQDRRTGGAELRARLQTGAPLLRAWAVRGLGALGDPSTRRLVAETLRHDPDPGVRAEAALALLRLGGDEASFGAALLEDRAAPVRRQSALGLGAMAQPAPVAPAILRLALDDVDPNTRVAAAWALARRSEPGQRGEVLDLLTPRLLAEPDAAVRLGYLTALSELGPASAGVLSDVAVADAREPAQRRLVRRALQLLDPSAPGTNPGLGAALRRWLRSDDPELARAAAAALARAGLGVDANLTVRALLDTLARGSAAAPALLAGLAALVDRGPLRDAAREVAELATAGTSPEARASGLLACVRLQTDDALRAVQNGLGAGDAVTRAAAARAALELSRSAPDAERLLQRALADRSPWVTASVLRAHADANAGPLRVLAGVDPELVPALADTLTAPRQEVALSTHLARIALRPDADPVARALAVRATAALADAEDAAARALLAIVGHDGDELSQHALSPEGSRPWPGSSAPRLRQAFDWTWLHTPPRLGLRTTAGTIWIELAAAAAPVHVCALLARLEDAAAPTLVLAREDGWLRLGRDDLRRPAPEQLLRREPSVHDPFAVGLLGCVPSGLPDLDGLDLFLTLEPQPNWLLNHTIIGRVVGGMEVVETLHAGAQILDITVVRRPN